MSKLYWVVDQQSGEIAAEKRIGTLGQAVFNACPEKRKGLKIQYCGMICGEISLVLAALIVIFPALFQILIEIVVLLAIMFLLLIPIGEIIKRSGEAAIGSTDSAQTKVPWADPYGLAREPIDGSDPIKKLYYIVDPEKNAIVDVKRLGKWGQAYVERRRKRQQQT